MSARPPVTILHVEDDEATRTSLAWVLAPQGFRILGAATGQEGLARAREQPDLILLDVRLPDMSGFDVCRQLRADPDTAAIPIIQISGLFTTQDHRVQGLEQGADVYLTKTVDPRELIAQIRSLLRVRNAERSYRTLAENVPDVIVRFDRDLHHIYVNRRIEEVTGRSPSIFLGKTIHDVGATAGPVWPWEESVRQVFASGEPTKLDFEFSTSGGWRWFEARLSPELASGGSVESVLVVCRDVTEQKGLLDVVKLLSSAQGLERVTRIVREAARNLTQADGITFILRDGEHCYYADEDAIGPLWKGRRFPMSECISGWCMHHRQSIAIADIYADERVPADAYRSTFVKSLAIVPIRREAPIGAIGAYWSKAHAATPSELSLLEALAVTTAVALTNVQLFRSLEQRAEDNRRLYEQAQSQIRQREQVEQSLREQEAHFRAFFENVAVGAAQIDTAGRFIRVNDRYCTITGYSREELVGGMGPLDLDHPEDRKSDRERITDFLAGAIKVYDTQKRYVRKDGRIAWVHVSASTVDDDTGRPRYTAAIVDDITARKLLEDQLTEANQRFVDTLNSVSDLLVTFDAGWRYTFLNDRAAQFTGHRVEDLLGQVIWEVFPQAVGTQFYREVTEAATTRSLRVFQTHYSDRQRWYEHRAYPAPYGIALVSSDITDRKRAEEAAHNLAALVESSQDAIIGKDLDGTITSWNGGAAQLYGYSAPEVLGRPITMLVPPERVDEILGILKRVKQGKRVDQLETVRVRKDGRQIHVSLTVSPIRNADQIVIGASAIARDITQRKLLEEQLRQSQKMEAVGQLAGGVAHDFNNLLTVITGYSEMVLSKLPKEAPFYPMLLAIRRAGDRAASLTRQLLAFSRKQVLQPVVLDLNVLIRELEKMLGRLIGEDINLTTVLDPQLGKVRADPGQIEQVILNLAINARDAMPEGGRLIIETQNMELDAAYAGTHADVSPGPYIQVTVTDEGSGQGKITLLRRVCHEHAFQDVGIE